MKNIATIKAVISLALPICALCLFCQTAAGQEQENKPIKNQEPALNLNQDKKLIYIPERTKEELAEQRLQKREKEAIELQKKPVLSEAEINDEIEYRVIDENTPVNSELIIMEKYRVSETPVKHVLSEDEILEEPILMKEYKPEGKEEQKLKKEKLQKPENKK